MELRFRERREVREFAAAHGVAKLEEELDTGALDLASVILVEQWLDDEPARLKKRRRKMISRIWNAVAILVCLVAVGAVGFLVWAMLN